MALVRQRPDLTLVPPAALRLTLGSAARVGAGQASGRQADRAAAAGQTAVAGPKREASDPRAPAAPSWWTARARAGEVKPGFTKEEILRAGQGRPAGPGGVFERVGGLLSELLRSSVRCWFAKTLAMTNSTL